MWSPAPAPVYVNKYAQARKARSHSLVLLRTASILRRMSAIEAASVDDP